MRNYVAACVNNHNEITGTEESNYVAVDFTDLFSMGNSCLGSSLGCSNNISTFLG